MLTGLLSPSLAAHTQQPGGTVYRVQELDPPPSFGQFSSIVDLSDEGLILAGDENGYYSANPNRPWVHLHTLDGCNLDAMNSRRQVCGTTEIADIRHAFVAKPNGQGTYDKIQLLPNGTFAGVSHPAINSTDIDDNGTVVGAVRISSADALSLAAAWEPDATEPSIYSSNTNAYIYRYAFAISPTGHLASGLAHHPILGFSLFTATSPNNTYLIPSVWNGTPSTTHAREVTDNNRVLVDIVDDTLKSSTEVWIVSRGLFQPKYIAGNGTAFAISRMSSEGRVLCKGDQLYTWVDDNSPNGLRNTIDSLHLWTDHPPTLSFEHRGGDINNHGEIAIRTLKPAQTYGVALLIPTCRADVNADGIVNKQDLTAWIDAYQSNSHRADQNADGMLTHTDFTAWLAGFNAGCDLH